MQTRKPVEGDKSQGFLWLEWLTNVVARVADSGADLRSAFGECRAPFFWLSVAVRADCPPDWWKSRACLPTGLPSE